jgi:hypothetical protein
MKESLRSTFSLISNTAKKHRSNESHNQDLKNVNIVLVEDCKYQV